MLNIILRKSATFLRLPAFVKLWVVPLWFLLGLAKAFVILIPFRNVAPRLGTHMGDTPRVPLLSSDFEARARLIGHAIRLSAKYTPWDSNCFPQAIAARVLLGLYHVPYTLCFGLRCNRDSCDLTAHAWVCAGRVYVTGGASFGQFTVVGVFVSPQRVASSKG